MSDPTDTPTTEARTPSWLEGYRIGKANLAASQISGFPSWLNWHEFDEGYVVGVREGREVK